MKVDESEWDRLIERAKKEAPMKFWYYASDESLPEAASIVVAQTKERATKLLMVALKSFWPAIVVDSDQVKEFDTSVECVVILSLANH